MSETARCGKCELIQNRRTDNLCRRCHTPLPTGRIESTTVVIVDRTTKRHKRPTRLRDLIEEAALTALQQAKTIKGAADVLDITPFRLIGILAKVDKQRLGALQIPKRKPRWTPEKKKSQAAWVAQRRTDGLCVRCGGVRDGSSVRNCESCLKKTRQYRKRKRGE